jgi:hypothetical protein
MTDELRKKMLRKKSQKKHRETCGAAFHTAPPLLARPLQQLVSLIYPAHLI